MESNRSFKCQKIKNGTIYKNQLFVSVLLIPKFAVHNFIQTQLHSSVIYWQSWPGENYLALANVCAYLQSKQTQRKLQNGHKEKKKKNSHVRNAPEVTQFAS